MASDVIRQNPDDMNQFGQLHIDHGTAHAQAASDWIDQLSNAFNQLGPIYHPVVSTWHGSTKDAASAAHSSYANACIQFGTTCQQNAQTFSNTEASNAATMGAVSAEGAAGIPTSNGISTT